jgi:hypothetical protein
MTDKPADDDIAPDEPVPVPGATDAGGTADATDAPAAPVGRGGRTVRLGCLLLVVISLLGVVLGAVTASDPEQTQCTQARAILEDEDEVDDGGDVECDDAIAQAAALDEADEAADADEVDAVAEESTIRTFALIVGAIGLLQIVGAALTLRLRTKGARLAALVGAALGIVFSPLGLLAVPVLGFVVYAILFSADARAVFGMPGGPRALRPRT